MTITLYKENRTDKAYTVTLQEIADKFMASPYNHDDYHNSWPLERTIRAFLTADDGMNSVFDESDYPTIHEAIRNALYPSD